MVARTALLLVVEQALALGQRGGPGRDAHLDPLYPRRQKRQGDRAGGHAVGIVGVERVDSTLERLGQPGLAGAPGAQHPADDDALLSGLGHAGAQVGQDGAVEHLGHLVGHAGNGVDHLVPQRADEARRGAGALLDDGGAPRHVGLTGVVGRHGAAPGLEEAGDAVHDLLVAHERHSHDIGEGFPGDVVLSGAEAAADDDAVAAGQRGAEGQDDAVVVVADRLVEMRGDAGRGQLVAQPGAVGVGDLAQQQLGADRHDLDPHPGAAPAPVTARRPSRKYCRPVMTVSAAATQTTASCTPVVDQRRCDAGADGQVLYERLELGRVPGRDGYAAAPDP